MRERERRKKELSWVEEVEMSDAALDGARDNRRSCPRSRPSVPPRFGCACSPFINSRSFSRSKGFERTLSRDLPAKGNTLLSAEGMARVSFGLRDFLVVFLDGITDAGAGEPNTLRW